MLRDMTMVFGYAGECPNPGKWHTKALKHINCPVTSKWFRKREANVATCWQLVSPVEGILHVHFTIFELGFGFYNCQSQKFWAKTVRRRSKGCGKQETKAGLDVQKPSSRPRGRQKINSSKSFRRSLTLLAESLTHCHSSLLHAPRPSFLPTQGPSSRTDLTAAPSPAP